MSKVKNNNGSILTYRFNQKLFSEFEKLKAEYYARLKTGKACDQILWKLALAQRDFERSKAISRGKAIAKLRRQQADV